MVEEFRVRAKLLKLQADGGDATAAANYVKWTDQEDDLQRLADDLEGADQPSGKLFDQFVELTDAVDIYLPLLDDALAKGLDKDGGYQVRTESYVVVVVV